MSEDIKQIGQRLKGLREVLEIPVEEMAEVCDTTVEHYLRIEAGESDPSVSGLSMVAKRYGVSLDELLFGEEPRMQHYFLTRKGHGQQVERRKEYIYQSLASSFKGRKMDPFLTQIDPLPEGKDHAKNTHDGQEFNYVIEGSMELTIGNKVMRLEVGDSIYFDAQQPHCMKALDGKPVKFLAIIV
jgi:mannose-6-phosphate isomerase-like protein (cupin superfamily)